MASARRASSGDGNAIGRDKPLHGQEPQALNGWTDEQGVACDNGHLRHAACGQEGLDCRDNGASSADHVVHNDRSETLDIAHNPLDPHLLAAEAGLMHDG
jgi:hypothetical protein